MRISRIYLPIVSSDINDTVSINDGKAHYIRNVLRLKIGQKLVFFTADGCEYQSQIQSIEKHQVILHSITAAKQQTASASIQTCIIQGISSSDRMDYCVQKSAEMGGHTLIPVITDHCANKIPVAKQAKRQAHWQAVAISASEQSGRCDVLKIAEIQPLSQLVNQLQTGLFMDTQGNHSIHELEISTDKPINIFIGPEGGFSKNEMDAFHAQGFTDIKLGQRILRTETAAPVILSALHTLYGDFKLSV